MISEQRLLTFSHDSLTEAILRFNKDKRAFLPEGDVIAIEVTGEHDPAVRIRIQIPDRIFEKAVNLSAAQLAAIMIHHCIKQRIPIPKQGHKEIRHVGGDIALSIAIGESKDPAPVSAPAEKDQAPSARMRGEPFAAASA